MKTPEEIIDALAVALRQAKPLPAVFPVDAAVRIQSQTVGWRYAVVKIADALQTTFPQFDRAAFNKTATGEG